VRQAKDTTPSAITRRAHNEAGAAPRQRGSMADQ
jgi:hypothetical protein